jgi:hypothetical protein
MSNGIYLTAELIINEMISDLISNQTLMKYVVYDDTSIDPATKPNVLNPSQYIFKPEYPEVNTYRIFQIHKIPAVEENQKTIISAYLVKTKKIEDNPTYKDFIIAFDVITHININAIKGCKLRLLRILNEIDKVYNQKYTSQSIKKLFALDDTYIEYNNNFCGYRLLYSATNFAK